LDNQEYIMNLYHIVNTCNALEALIGIEGIIASFDVTTPAIEYNPGTPATDTTPAIEYNPGTPAVISFKDDKGIELHTIYTWETILKFVAAESLDYTPDSPIVPSQRVLDAEKRIASLTPAIGA